MQNWCEDYYEICEFGEGCCLNCPDSYEGCLCYECKCKQCYWYTPPEEYDREKGHCDKTDELIKEKREEWRKEMIFKNKKSNKLFEKKIKANEKELKRLKDKGTILNYYSCQKCGFCFVTENEQKIINKKTPVCIVCSGKIGLTEEEIKKINNEVEEEILLEEHQEWINRL